MTTETNMKNKKPNPIDVYVGGRIKLRRNMLGLSQEKLGDESWPNLSNKINENVYDTYV